MNKKRLKQLWVATLAFLTVVTFTGQSAFVSAKANVDKAMKESGIAKTGDASGIFTSLSGVVYFVMAIGGFWIVGMLAWGGMTLAGSGGNPQKRTEGFIKLALTLVGAYIIFKAYDIAGWATGIGETK